MPNRTSSRAASNARNEILTRLKEDHKQLKKAYREFTKLDPEEDPQRCQARVHQALVDLELHATLEEELLYPAAHNAIADPDLIDEAEVEHESAHALINQLKGMEVDDEKFGARFTVLCEYVLHHIKEEEGELFRQLQSARLDWESLAREMSERRAELAPSGEGEGLSADDGRARAGDRAQAGAQTQPAGKVANGGRARASRGDGMGAEPGQAMTSRRV